uniref:Ribosomal RNA methyltransferase FtsJ domain-containing protein n=1 Tax=Chromera velia CCMP2878 TaxID=1169474 RepID=A0A0G4HC23_9ALVE|eukprot:Cvel_26093.t1-p1 / transcript=Cvel_26093.t1 / gene=Cvel_26093 / organism=Chromera_velia_CCMP2878 / gene_product=Putative rRNA methyltransferase YqxC, putative / transcript_product=Putative rRNA methyltransferase YqxC, putative / location=Cvel_scaffold3049:5596-10233(-) / protein_length=499 / sequence_SO=supercontig / SO=protein_coding / is_pseudo=false
MKIENVEALKPSRKGKMRADELLVSRGLVETRSCAASLILLGRLRVEVERKGRKGKGKGKLSGQQKEGGEESDLLSRDWAEGLVGVGGDSPGLRDSDRSLEVANVTQSDSRMTSEMKQRDAAEALPTRGKEGSEGEWRVVQKAGELLREDAHLFLDRPSKFVSRAGDKLDGFLEGLLDDSSIFSVEGEREGGDWSLKGKTVIDIGASTGGFTDCCLQRGASHVTCIDVGKAQLSVKLREDPRVFNLEGVNARYLHEWRHLLPLQQYDALVIDVSFISLRKVLPSVWPLLKDNGLLVALVKPQFEATKEEAARGKGVIRNPLVRFRAIASVLSLCEDTEAASSFFPESSSSSSPYPQSRISCRQAKKGNKKVGASADEEGGESHVNVFVPQHCQTRSDFSVKNGDQRIHSRKIPDSEEEEQSSCEAGSSFTPHVQSDSHHGQQQLLDQACPPSDIEGSPSESLKLLGSRVVRLAESTIAGQTGNREALMAVLKEFLTENV